MKSHTSLREPSFSPLDSVRRPGKHDRLWAVERRDHQLIGGLRDVREGHSLGQHDREHRTAARGLFTYEKAPFSDHPHGVAEREHPCQVGRGRFAHAMAQERVRREAPRAPQRPQRNLHAKENELNDIGFIQAGAPLVDQKLIEDGPMIKRLHKTVAGFDFLAEHRLLYKQRAPHAEPLRALARTDEDKARSRFRFWRFLRKACRKPKGQFFGSTTPKGHTVSSTDAPFRDCTA
jgi:hypothetical protein